MLIFKNFFKDKKLSAKEIAIETENGKYKLLPEYLGKIIKSDSNENGSYIKFDNGIMVCWGKRQFVVSNNNTVGSLKYGGPLNLGNYPEIFIDTPTTTLTIKGNMAVAEYEYGGVSNIGQIYVFNATSRTNQTEIVNFIAFGKWK